jgi:hypothetical protein
MISNRLMVRTLCSNPGQTQIELAALGKHPVMELESLGEQGVRGGARNAGWPERSSTSHTPIRECYPFRK